MPKAHACYIYKMYIPNTWALAIALSYSRVGICEILMTVDKALVQRLFFSMSAKRWLLSLSKYQRLTWQRNEKILD